MAIYYESELCHHGIKGQRWGVRRYQNYDGSYTQRGVRRYQQALADRNNAYIAKRSAKQALRDHTGSKQAYKEASSTFKKAKAKEKKSYENLKSDKAADQGKALYKQGQTISGNMKVNAIAQGSIVIGSRIVSAAVMAKTGNRSAAYASASVLAVGGTAVNAIIAGKTYRNNKRLRAYYAH